MSFGFSPGCPVILASSYPFPSGLRGGTMIEGGEDRLNRFCRIGLANTIVKIGKVL